MAVVTGARLRKETLLEVLNAEACALGVARPIDDRDLRDWIGEKLIPSPTRTGLGRGLGSKTRYSPSALAAAREVVRLKAASPERRNTVLRIRLWLLGFDVSIDRVAEDLESEFSRLLRRRFFRGPFQYDASAGNKLSEREKERERRRAGPLDPRFVKAGFELPPDDLLDLVWELVSDPSGPSKLFKVLDQLVSPYLSDRSRSIYGDTLKNVEPYVNVAGLFGAPDEIEKSGLEAFASIGGADLLKGRRLYQFALAMFDAADRGIEFLPADMALALAEPASATNRTLRESDEWCVAGLAVSAIAASWARSSGSPR